jgi:ribosomal protein S18 acetylase RimI-like enzyme
MFYLIIFGIVAVGLVYYLYFYEEPTKTQVNKPHKPKHKKTKKKEDIEDLLDAIELPEPEPQNEPPKEQLIIKDYEELAQQDQYEVNELFKVCFADEKPNESGFDQNPLMYVLKYEGHVIGYACLLNTPKFILYMNKQGVFNQDMYGVKSNNGMYLYNFCIDPNFRGNKYAQKLLGKIIGDMKEDNVEYMNLTVVSDKEDAIYIYKKFGFFVDRQNMATDNKHVYTMVKYLMEN